MHIHKKMIFPLSEKCTMDTFQILIEDIKKNNPDAKDFVFDFYQLRRTRKKKLVVEFCHSKADKKEDKVCVVLSKKNFNSLDIMGFLINLYKEIKFDLKIISYNKDTQDFYPNEKKSLYEKIEKIGTLVSAAEEKDGYLSAVTGIINSGEKYTKIYYIKDPAMYMHLIKGVRYLSTYYVSTYSHNTVIDKFFKEDSSICL